MAFTKTTMTRVMRKPADIAVADSNISILIDPEANRGQVVLAYVNGEEKLYKRYTESDFTAAQLKQMLDFHTMVSAKLKLDIEA